MALNIENKIKAAIQSFLRTEFKRDTLLANNVEVQQTDTNISIYLSDYAKYIESGRKAGTNVPIAALSSWLRRAGISDTNGLVWRIQAAIRRRGIKPHKYLDRLDRVVSEVIEEYYDIEINNNLIIE